jgi:hypothetical protein
MKLVNSRQKKLDALREKAIIYRKLHQQAALTMDSALAVIDRLERISASACMSELDQLCLSEAERYVTEVDWRQR